MAGCGFAREGTGGFRAVERVTMIRLSTMRPRYGSLRLFFRGKDGDVRMAVLWLGLRLVTSVGVLRCVLLA